MDPVSPWVWVLTAVLLIGGALAVWLLPGAQTAPQAVYCDQIGKIQLPTGSQCQAPDGNWYRLGDDGEWSLWDPPVVIPAITVTHAVGGM